MTNTLLLEQKIKESGFKRKYIAQRLGISTYCLSQKIRNVREFKGSEMDILSSILKIDSAEDRVRIFFHH